MFGNILQRIHPQVSMEKVTGQDLYEVSNGWCSSQVEGAHHFRNEWRKNVVKIYDRIPSLKLWMVGILLSYWGGLFSGAVIRET